jgi:hypothetical protein
MSTQAELAEERRVRDEPMLEMVRAGRTARQIGDVVGLAPTTVRHRALRYGLKCQTSQARTGVAPRRKHRAVKPCKCPGVCTHRNVLSEGHRFGPDLTCECGASWESHQREPVACTVPQRPECVSSLEEQCVNGHPPGELYVSPQGKRQCRQCRTDNDLKRKEKARRVAERKAEVAERKANWTPATHCNRGHEYNEANTYISPQDGKRHCRPCRAKIAADRRKEDGR